MKIFFHGLVILINALIDLWSFLCGALGIALVVLYLVGSVTFTVKQNIKAGEEYKIPVKQFVQEFVHIKADLNAER